jgi:TolA-binding protein
MRVTGFGLALLCAGPMWACHAVSDVPHAAPLPAPAWGHLAARLAHVEEQLQDLRLQVAVSRSGAMNDVLPDSASIAMADENGPETRCEAALSAGAHALAQGHLQQAQNQFAQALALAPARGPQAARSLLWLADTAVEQGAHRVAAHHLQRFLQEHNQHPQRHAAALRLGIAHEALHAYAVADALFTTIVTDHPASTSAQVAKVHLQRAKGVRP